MGNTPEAFPPVPHQLGLALLLSSPSGCHIYSIPFCTQPPHPARFGVTRHFISTVPAPVQSPSLPHLQHPILHTATSSSPLWRDGVISFPLSLPLSRPRRYHIYSIPFCTQPPHPARFGVTRHFISTVPAPVRSPYRGYYIYSIPFCTQPPHPDRFGVTASFPCRRPGKWTILGPRKRPSSSYCFGSSMEHGRAKH